MNQGKYTIVAVILAGMLLCFAPGLLYADAGNPSGRLVNGFRVLKWDHSSAPDWQVFRGDYLKIDIGESTEPPVLSIPALSVKIRLTQDLAQMPYIKIKQAGQFNFTIGEAQGRLTVIEYTDANYEAVSALRAREVIKSFAPLVLDVRTPGEYAAGHLKDSVLIPVQLLQSRWDQLAAHKDDPILIYCATGNRSTVASKILIDHGFTRIFNLKNGIADWARQKYPIVRPD